MSAAVCAQHMLMRVGRQQVYEGVRAAGDEAVGSRALWIAQTALREPALCSWDMSVISCGGS